MSSLSGVTCIIKFVPSLTESSINSCTLLFGTVFLLIAIARSIPISFNPAFWSSINEFKGYITRTLPGRINAEI